jgi:hypothetical protein
METQTNGTTWSTTYSVWNCAGCMNCRNVKCGECGCEKDHCDRLNIDVEKDFYCKYYIGKYVGTYTFGPYQYTYTVNHSGDMVKQSLDSK